MAHYRQTGISTRTDLILSAVDNFVDNFRRQGIRSELLRFGFEPATPDRLGEPERSVLVSFVGSLSGAHASRRRWLEYVGEHVPLQVWAPSIEGLSDRSSIARGYQGAAWGAKRADIFRTSRITLNRHADIAGIYAGNKRLFDATGAGCLLITDWKTNLSEMFDPGKEVVTYRTPEECVETIQVLSGPRRRRSSHRACRAATDTARPHRDQSHTGAD